MYRIAGIFRGYKCLRFSRIKPVPRKFMNSRRVQYYGFEANGVEVQLHVDACVHAPKGWNSDHENKIREILCNGPSAKIYTLEIYPLYGIHALFCVSSHTLLV